MQALVVAAHGSHLNAGASTPAYDHADRVRATGAFDEVRAAFWKEEPGFREVLRTLASEEVYVVPLFVSEGYFTERVLPRELRLEGWDAAAWDSDGTSATHATLTAADTGQTVHYCGPVGTHDATTDVIVRRAESVTGDPGVGEGFGLAVVGHGTERNEHSARAIHYHADRVRESGRFSEVRALFMDEEPAVEDLTDRFESEDVVLVPLFVADGYHTREDIPEDAGLTDDYREGWETPATVDGHRVWYAGAVGTEPTLAGVLLERAADAGADVEGAAERLRTTTEGSTATRRVVVDRRLTMDRDERETAPTDEQLDALRAAAADGVDCDGLVVRRRADGFHLSVPEATREGLDADALAAAAAEHAPYVTNWHFWRAVAPGRDDHRAFLRWVERAEARSVPERYRALREGATAEWGQLRIVAELEAAGERRYELRHVDDAATGSNEADADAPSDALTDHGDPLDARRLAKRDDRGRYRPLSTAPTLPTGWRFPDLGATDLLEAVEDFYPATVANWHREREGDLDVSHWTETAERQTGIYDLVDELDREAVEWIAEACCVDSQCLRRREWEYDEGAGLSADGGDGPFPCREPCSLVIAAAREWTLLERERPRTYELELTPSEKEQLEALVDAVAEGRAGELREADFSDGANRYRARYLRAKLFEDGSLPAIERTHEDDSGE